MLQPLTPLRHSVLSTFVDWYGFSAFAQQIAVIHDWLHAVYCALFDRGAGSDITNALLVKLQSLFDQPVAATYLMLLLFIALSWMASLLPVYGRRRLSWVDRLWSITPICYVGYTFIVACVQALRFIDTSPRAAMVLDALRDAGYAWPRTTLLTALLGRLALATALVVAWGVRLTYNFWRRGGYWLAFEDARWKYARSWFRLERPSPPVPLPNFWLFRYLDLYVGTETPDERARSPTWINRWTFELFNFAFVAVFNHALLYMLCAPVFLLWQLDVAARIDALADNGAAVPLDVMPDATVLAASALAAFWLWLEARADAQQQAFQSFKHRAHQVGAAAAARTLDTSAKRDWLPQLHADTQRGFLAHGLFRYSRHPNFFAEIAFWNTFHWLPWLVGVNAHGLFAGLRILGVPLAPAAVDAGGILRTGWLPWTLVSPLALVLLFQGSTWLTEAISSRKYLHYPAYQRSTSRLVPWWPRRPASKEL